MNVAARGLEPDIEAASLLSNSQPVSANAARSRDIEIPTAYERAGLWKRSGYEKRRK